MDVERQKILRLLPQEIQAAGTQACSPTNKTAAAILVMAALPFIGLIGDIPQACGDTGKEVNPKQMDNLPSAELLLFLADFSDVDEETFNLILEKGKQDAHKQQMLSAKKDQRGDPDDHKK